MNLSRFASTVCTLNTGFILGFYKMLYDTSWLQKVCGNFVQKFALEYLYDLWIFVICKNRINSKEIANNLAISYNLDSSKFYGFTRV